MNPDTFDARADAITPALLAAELARPEYGEPVTREQLRRALALRRLADRLPENLFDDLPRDLSQQPVPDDLGDAMGVLLLARDVFGEPDGVSDAGRDIVAALLGNMAVRLRAVMQWRGHCRMESDEALADGGAA
jgi:hypothetical protein